MPAIIENNNEIAFAINQILGEGIDDVTQRIADDFSQTGGDNYEIINPYADDMVSNTNAFIGQYCAAKNEDWENISLSDLEQTLRAEISDLYTFSRTSETRTIPDDPDTEEDESGTETWYIYTIVYQGEAHFADEIFHLTDEQKELADNYAQNLSLFLGDGMFQSTTGNVIPSLGDVRFSNGAVEVVYYNQYDERYANKPYGTDNIGGYGCGPTSMAIVVSSLTDDIVDPIEMAKWSYDNGYWCSKSGSYHALIPAAAKEWGLPVEGLFSIRTPANCRCVSRGQTGGSLDDQRTLHQQRPFHSPARCRGRKDISGRSCKYHPQPEIMGFVHHCR